jgi:hypothetical protein
MVWLVGWRRGKQLYKTFYQEEFARLEKTLVKDKVAEEKMAETIEEKVQKALRDRWK